MIISPTKEQDRRMRHISLVCMESSLEKGWIEIAKECGEISKIIHERMQAANYEEQDKIINLLKRMA